MKATAETSREAAGEKLLDAFEEDGICHQLVDAVIGTLPITLEQLAGIANGESVLVNRTELLNPLSKKARQEIEEYIEACSDGEPSGAALQVVLERLDRLAALVASPEKGKTT